MYGEEGGVGTVGILFMDRNRKSDLRIVFGFDSHDNLAKGIANLLDYRMSPGDRGRGDDLGIVQESVLLGHHLNSLHASAGSGWEASISNVWQESYFEVLGETAFIPTAKDTIVSVLCIDSLFGTHQDIYDLGLEFEGDFSTWDARLMARSSHIIFSPKRTE